MKIFLDMMTMELEMARGTLSWRTKLRGTQRHPQEDNAKPRKPNDLVEKVNQVLNIIILYFVSKTLSQLG